MFLRSLWRGLLYLPYHRSQKTWIRAVPLSACRSWLHPSVHCLAHHIPPSRAGNLSIFIPQLMIWRFLHALGASPGLAVGSGAIGDIYQLEEQGQAIGIFFAAVLLGPALAPVTGGFAAHYFSWHLIQIWLGSTGTVVFFVVLFFFPETYHPGQ
ncbi:hypothetical protein GALMADRAFT_595797 [Galerina marginata CBS 339.88]|uniref:Major facilitator superfamily (MFS) profile domain-containing protein n=1 Tax=Galerina marginata (strain CBS 339.88) TaxID=685588 RepID=A0A067SSX5_GALM3|nr:hypothetical protein GALMADRAFT_595797 [Galerina marginata CBS 339.88]